MSPIDQHPELRAAWHETIDDFKPYAINYQEVKGNRFIYWDNAIRSTAHIGPYLLFQYHICGQLWFDAGHGRRCLQNGEAFLVEVPSQTEYGLELGDSAEWVWIAFRGSEAQRWVKSIQEAHGPSLLLGDHIAARALINFYDDTVSGRLSDPWEQSAALFHLLSLIRCWAEDYDQTGLPLPQVLLRAQELIEEQFHNADLDINSMSNELGITRFYFTRLAKKHWHQSPAQRLRQRRLQHAQHLLHSTELRVDEVAFRSGFTSSAYFCACFKKHFNETPGSIRVI